jgi:CHAT domain-containing protein
MMAAFPAPETASRAEARRLWVAALDRQSVLDVDSAVTLFRRASAVDPSYLPAHYDYWKLSVWMGREAQLLAEYQSAAGMPAAHRECVLAVIRSSDFASAEWIDRFRQLRARYGSTGCIAFGVSRALTAYPVARRGVSAEEMRASRQAAAAFPEHHESVAQLLLSLERAGRRREALETARRAAAQPGHLLQRIGLVGWVIRVSLAARDSAGARQAMAALQSEVERDGRPLIRYAWHSSGLPSLSDAHSAAAAAILALIADRPELRGLAVGIALSLAAPLIESGRFREALAMLEPHGQYVVSRGMSQFETRLRLLEGRALVRSGDPRGALVPLAQALAAAQRMGHVGYVADAHHQLTHAHEALGDWRQAARSADQFVAAASRTLDPGMRVISRHDAASVRWRAGWHAAADSLWRLMVRVIEREERHYAYAAEYHERVGNPGRAVEYLRRALEPDAFGVVSDQDVSYAALTRLFLALGQFDSAMVYARQHDALESGHRDRLVARVHAAAGNADAALASLSEWVPAQLRRGNIASAVRAQGAIAELLLGESPGKAAVLAEATSHTASRHGLVSERIDALRVRGEAAARTGDPRAFALLEEALRLSQRHPDAAQGIVTRLALADALLLNGRRHAALRHYREAIVTVERGAVSLADDVAAARFKATRARAFDGALRAVLSGEPVWAEVREWSARKKGASAALAARASRTRPARGEAILDYVATTTGLWVVVVTRDSVSSHRLDVSVEAAAQLTRMVLASFTTVVGGRIDLARASFHDRAAATLYDRLLRPIEHRLRGVDRLVIVPDGPTHAVPFEALLRRRAPAEYVLDRWVVRYALNAPVEGSAARIRLRGRVLVVASTAPAADEEAVLVGRAWRDGVHTVGRDSATETALASRGRDFPILHVAAHARSDQRDPLASYVLLAADESNDGMLHYSEIVQGSARHTLVVLNSCETSAGALLAGSGPMSLARAYLVSGSSAVIATRWPVGAASARLAALVYENAARGADAAEALHEARLALRRDSSTAHPFFWASHVFLQR